MKKYLALILFALLTTLAFAQSDYQDVVYLKNGSIIRGVVIEQVPNKSLKIETYDKSVFVYEVDEIEKLTKEKANFENEKIKKGSRLNQSNQESSKIRFGIKGGFNLSKLRAFNDDNPSGYHFRFIPGFKLGVSTEFKCTKSIAFETGILFSTKGTTISELSSINDDEFDFINTVSLLYLEIPLTAKAYFNIGKAKMFGVFGPYIGLGISGKTKLESIINGSTEKTEIGNINWDSSTENNLKPLTAGYGIELKAIQNLKPLDYGLTAGAGIEIKSIQIGLSYNLGIANISTNPEEERIHVQDFGLSIGYFFGRR